METTETILVIFLSSALAVSLLLSVIVLVKVIQLVNTLKRIAEKAEAIADKAETIGGMFSKAAGPVAVGRFMTHLAESVFGKSKSKSKRSE